MENWAEPRGQCRPRKCAAGGGKRASVFPFRPRDIVEEDSRAPGVDFRGRREELVISGQVTGVCL